GVIGPLADGFDTRVRAVGGITLDAVVGGRAAAEFRIGALGCMNVVVCHRALQALHVDAAALGELRNGWRAVQIARSHIGAYWKGEWPGSAQAVAALECVVADQPCLERFAFWRRGDQGGDEIMIRAGLIDEPAAVAHYRNETGLCPFDQ